MNASLQSQILLYGRAFTPLHSRLVNPRMAKRKKAKGKEMAQSNAVWFSSQQIIYYTQFVCLFVYFYLFLGGCAEGPPSGVDHTVVLHG